MPRDLLPIKYLEIRDLYTSHFKAGSHLNKFLPGFTGLEILTLTFGHGHRQFFNDRDAFEKMLERFTGKRRWAEAVGFKETSPKAICFRLHTYSLFEFTPETTDAEKLLQRFRNHVDTLVELDQDL